MASRPWPLFPGSIRSEAQGANLETRTDLSRMERHLWRYLVAQAGRTVSRDELLRRVWGMDPQHVTTRTVDMHVAKLRKKLGEPPRRPSLLQTVRGSGYRVSAVPLRLGLYLGVKTAPELK